MELSSLTIMLPAFNEERIIEKAINSCREVAEKVASDYEILIVDDGSRDRTSEIIKDLARSNPRIRGIFLPRQTGYGNVLTKGFYGARKEFVFYTDSDSPIDIASELPKAVSQVSEDVDAVIGYRVNRNEDIPVRRIYSIIYNFMVHLLFGVRVRDVNFSCKLLRRSVFDKFKLCSRTVFIDGELLANLDSNGFRIKEFSATYVSRKHGRSNFDSPIYAFKVFIEMFIFWIKRIYV